MGGMVRPNPRTTKVKSRRIWGVVAVNSLGTRGQLCSRVHVPGLLSGALHREVSHSTFSEVV